MTLPQRVALNLGGTAYQLTIKWNAPANEGEGVWILDIADQDGVAIVQGLPLVTGAGMLEQFAYLGIPGDLVALSDFDPSAPPTFDNLGVTSQLYYVQR